MKTSIMPATRRDKGTMMRSSAFLVGAAVLYIGALSGVESSLPVEPVEDAGENLSNERALRYYKKKSSSPANTGGGGTCVDLPAVDEVTHEDGHIMSSAINDLKNGLQEEIHQGSADDLFCQETTENFSDNGHFMRAFSFHKTLPHDYHGQVDENAFEHLKTCAAGGESADCEKVPAGDYHGSLIDPSAGVRMDVCRLQRAGMGVQLKAPPSVTSAEMAAQVAECYWMSLVRDIPFNKYHKHPLTRKAAENLAYMPGFFHSNDVPSSGHKAIDPRRDLFRATFVGVRNGPMISQLLLRDYDMDAMTIRPMRKTFAPGIDYMTDHHSWLAIQNGAKPDSPEKHDRQLRFIRNGRDLGKLVYTDTIYTEAVEGALTIMQAHGMDRGGHNGPYTKHSRMKGFVDWGLSHLLRIIGDAADAHREAWFQKWQVHLFIRPEAFGGLVHDTVSGYYHYPIHDSLVNNWELLDRVARANVYQNKRNRISGRKQLTYLLSQGVKEGSPAHPSYPSGHAVLYGAAATVLKAIMGHERGKYCFPDPVYPSDDGLKLRKFKPTKNDWCFDEYGKERRGLTFEGEVNKLAANIAFGRQFLGVHYRMDGTEGIIFGETHAVRALHEEIKSLGDDDTFYKFRLFRGQLVKLMADGTFSVDGTICTRTKFRGADQCSHPE